MGISLGLISDNCEYTNQTINGPIGHIYAKKQIVSICVYAFTKQLNSGYSLGEAKRHILRVLYRPLYLCGPQCETLVRVHA